MRCSRADRSVVEEGSVWSKLRRKPVESLSQTRQERGGGRLDVAALPVPDSRFRETQSPKASVVPGFLSSWIIFVIPGRYWGYGHAHDKRPSSSIQVISNIRI